MNVVKVEDQAVTVNSGQVKLTKAQAAVRGHAIRQIGKADKDGGAVYDVISPLCFKVGESFGFSGEANKAGQLRDPEAEALAKMETEDRIRAEVRAEMEARHVKSLAGVKADFEARLKTALAEQETRLRAELAYKAAA